RHDLHGADLRGLLGGDGDIADAAARVLERRFARLLAGPALEGEAEGDGLGVEAAGGDVVELARRLGGSAGGAEQAGEQDCGGGRPEDRHGHWTSPHAGVIGSGSTATPRSKRTARLAGA